MSGIDMMMKAFGIDPKDMMQKAEALHATVNEFAAAQKATAADVAELRANIERLEQMLRVAMGGIAQGMQMIMSQGAETQELVRNLAPGRANVQDADLFQSIPEGSRVVDNIPASALDPSSPEFIEARRRAFEGAPIIAQSRLNGAPPDAREFGIGGDERSVTDGH